MTNDILKKNKASTGNLQDQVLSHLVQQRRLVDVYLINGIRLQGYLNGFDNYAIALSKSPGVQDALISHLVYKHTISTISGASGEK